MAWTVDGRGRHVPDVRPGAMSTDEFEQKLIEAVVLPSLELFVGYPLPKLNQAGARLYHATFLQYFSFFAWGFPSWLMAAASRCPHQDVRRTVIEDCVDEEVGDDEVGGRCHIDLLYEEAEACGITREQIAATEPTPIILACVHALENFARTLSWEGGFAALAALELLNCPPGRELRSKLLSERCTPEQIEAAKSGRSSAGLAERTGLPAEVLIFGSHHEYKDQAHGGGELVLLKKYATSREIQESMIWGARAGVSVFNVMWEEIHRLARAASGAPPRIPVLADPSGS